MIPRIGHNFFRLFLICIGFVSLALGLIGLFLPVLPTVPFLLLTAACFARSSDAFYNRLLGHPQLGPLIQGYMDGQGVPLRAKILSILLLWASILLSVVLFVPLFWVRLLLVVVAVCVTVYLLRLPASRN